MLYYRDNIRLNMIAYFIYYTIREYLPLYGCIKYFHNYIVIFVKNPLKLT